MNLRKTTVKDKFDNAVEALVAECPECKNDMFSILVIFGHNHLNCSKCGVSFCQDGGCDSIN